MPRLTRPAGPIVLAAALLCHASSAQAEDCDVVGCPDPGYVYIPMVTQNTIYQVLSQSGFKICQKPDDGQTFTIDGLPAVNDTVIIMAAQKGLYTEDALLPELDQFHPPAPPDPVRPGSDCKAAFHEPMDGNILRRGDRVRILGYRTFVNHYVLKYPAVDTPNFHSPAHERKVARQLLFALVTGPLPSDGKSAPITKPRKPGQ